MSVGQPEGVTLGEISRTLHALQEEIRALRGEHVRRDLYDAHRQATAAEIAQIRTELDRRDDDRTQTRRMVYGVGLAAALSLATQLITALAR